MKKPLYVSFPDAEVATASQAPAKQIWTCIVCFIVFNLFSFQQQRMMKQVQSASHGSLFALCFPFCLSERKTDRDKRERERGTRERFSTLSRLCFCLPVTSLPLCRALLCLLLALLLVLSCFYCFYCFCSSSSFFCEPAAFCVSLVFFLNVFFPLCLSHVHSLL